jgi:hypothetical protein
MAAATRFNDKRHSKWGSLSQRQEPLLTELQRLAANRPASRFKLDDWVKTPVGWKRISDRYHTNDGWRYRFLNNDGSLVYQESELRPLPDTQFTPESEVKLPDGQLVKVVGYAGTLVVVELRPKQMVAFTEETLRQHNPITEYALRLMVRAHICGEYLFEVDAKRAAERALPNYANNCL